MATKKKAPARRGGRLKVGRLALEELGGYLSGELALPELAPLLPRRDKAMVEIQPVYEDPDDPACAPELPAEARRGIEWLLANEAAVADAVKAAVARARPEAGVEVTSVHFHDVAGGALPYLGFMLEDPDDGEHGFGLMMHGTRIVKTGQADTAILEWIAEADAKARAKPRRVAKKGATRGSAERPQPRGGAKKAAKRRSRG